MNTRTNILRSGGAASGWLVGIALVAAGLASAAGASAQVELSGDTGPVLATSLPVRTAPNPVIEVEPADRADEAGGSVAIGMADFDRSGRVDELDLRTYLASWMSGSAEADLNRNGLLDIGDVFLFLHAWANGYGMALGRG